MIDITQSVIVAFDYKADKDHAILLVGQKSPKIDIQIVNAFEGDETKELWEKLTNKKEKDV